MATQRLVKLAHETGKRIHVLHISTKEEIEFLRDHKDVASCEVTPHHLTLVAPECYERLGTLAQMNPPVRGADHRAGIWRGIEQGIVDVLGSDHAPHTLEEKQKTYPASPSGMTGVQTLVPLMLDHVNAGRLSLARFVDLTSAGPARLFNIACKGRIAAGYDADFTIVDLKRSETITNKWVASKAGWTPYDGVTRHGLAGRHLHPRPPRDVAGRVGDAVAGRAGAVSGDVEAVGGFSLSCHARGSAPTKAIQNAAAIVG